MTADHAPGAGRREWGGLAVLALPTLLLSLDFSVLYLALPHLSADLGAGGVQQLWIMDVYGFMIAGFLVTMGTLGDRIGRRRLRLIGAAAFGVASVLAAFSTSAGMLIATRAVLGIAGATLMPSTLALLNNMFQDPGQRATAIAVWVGCFMGGATLGPVVGGAMLEFFWWGSVFLLGVPVMGLLLATGPLLLPEYRNPEAGRPDLSSVALSLGAILPFVYGIKELARDGWHVLPVVAIVASVAFGAAFVLRQRRLTDPLLDLRLFSDRPFSAALAISTLSGAVFGGFFLLFSLYLQLVEGLSPLGAGLWSVSGALAMLVGSLLAPRIARRVRPGNVIAAGLAIAALGFLLLTQLDGPGLALPVIGIVIVFLGGGPTPALGTDLIVGSAPPEKAGSAAAISETGGELGIALGVAVFGSVGTAVYRDRMADAVPSGVPAGAAETARDSLAGAVSAADRLPVQLGAELLDPAREAFTARLNAAAGAGAVLFVALAVLAAALLRHPRSGSEPEVLPASKQEKALAESVGVEKAFKDTPPRRGTSHEHA